MGDMLSLCCCDPVSGNWYDWWPSKEMVVYRVPYADGFNSGNFTREESQLDLENAEWSRLHYATRYNSRDDNRAGSEADHFVAPALAARVESRLLQYGFPNSSTVDIYWFASYPTYGGGCWTLWTYSIGGRMIWIHVDGSGNVTAEYRPEERLGGIPTGALYGGPGDIDQTEYGYVNGILAKALIDNHTRDNVPPFDWNCYQHVLRDHDRAPGYSGGIQERDSVSSQTQDPIDYTWFTPLSSLVGHPNYALNSVNEVDVVDQGDPDNWMPEYINAFGYGTEGIYQIGNTRGYGNFVQVDHLIKWGNDGNISVSGIVHLDNGYPLEGAVSATASPFTVVTSSETLDAPAPQPDSATYPNFSNWEKVLTRTSTSEFGDIEIATWVAGTRTDWSVFDTTGRSRWAQGQGRLNRWLNDRTWDGSPGAIQSLKVVANRTRGTETQVTNTATPQTVTSPDPCTPDSAWQEQQDSNTNVVSTEESTLAALNLYGYYADPVAFWIAEGDAPRALGYNITSVAYEETQLNQNVTVPGPDDSTNMTVELVHGTMTEGRKMTPMQVIDSTNYNDAATEHSPFVIRGYHSRNGSDWFCTYEKKDITRSGGATVYGTEEYRLKSSRGDRVLTKSLTNGTLLWDSDGPWELTPESEGNIYREYSSTTNPGEKSLGSLGFMDSSFPIDGVMILNNTWTSSGDPLGSVDVVLLKGLSIVGVHRTTQLYNVWATTNNWVYLLARNPFTQAITGSAMVSGTTGRLVTNKIGEDPWDSFFDVPGRPVLSNSGDECNIPNDITD